MQPPSANYAWVLEGLNRQYPHATGFETRALRNGSPINGYFKDKARAADVICSADSAQWHGFYATINPVIPDVMLRCEGRLEYHDKGSHTKDHEIAYRHALLIDIDPKRPSGIAASDPEHERALQLAADIVGVMAFDYGWSTPDMDDTGNGAHLRYYCYMPNTPETAALFREVLHKLALLFNKHDVEIDKTVFNASRITRIIGTVNRKGDWNEERPWRLSCPILEYRHDPLWLLTPSDLARFTGSVSLPGPRTFSGPAGAPPAHGWAPSGTGGPLNLLTASGPLSGAPPPPSYDSLDREALARLDEWVPVIFTGKAEVRGSGYAISSEALGRDRQERVSITPKGIKDFGEHDMPGEPKEGRRTPTEIIALFVTGDMRSAADLLASTLGRPAIELGPLKDLGPGVALGDPNAALGAGDAVQFLSQPNLSIDYMDGMDRPVNRDLIDGVLPREGAMLFSASTKKGKTTQLMQAATCMVMGVPLWGIAPTKVGRIWFYALESTVAQIKATFKGQYAGLCKDNAIEPSWELTKDIKSRLIFYTEKDPMIYERIKSGEMTPYTSFSLLAGIEAGFKTFPDLAVVVIDMLSMAEKDMRKTEGELLERDAAFLLACDSLAMRYGRLIILTEHNNKSNALARAEGKIGPEAAIMGTGRKPGSVSAYMVFDGSAEAHNTRGNSPQPTNISIVHRRPWNAKEWGDNPAPSRIRYDPMTYLTYRVDPPKFQPGVQNEFEDKVLKAVISLDMEGEYATVRAVSSKTGYTYKEKLTITLEALAQRAVIIGMAVNARGKSYCIPGSKTYERMIIDRMMYCQREGIVFEAEINLSPALPDLDI